MSNKDVRGFQLWLSQAETKRRKQYKSFLMKLVEVFKRLLKGGRINGKDRDSV